MTEKQTPQTFSLLECIVWSDEDDYGDDGDAGDDDDDGHVNFDDNDDIVMLNSYIPKAQKFAESAFQSQKISGKSA